VPEKSSSGLYSAREDIRGRHNDNLDGRHSNQTHQQPTIIIPSFLCQIPLLLQPFQFILLGTGTKYAGLHTQWFGYSVAWLIQGLVMIKKIFNHVIKYLN